MQVEPVESYRPFDEIFVTIKTRTEAAPTEWNNEEVWDRERSAVDLLVVQYVQQDDCGR